MWGPMPIWVTILTVDDIVIYVEDYDTVESVKEQIHGREGLPVDEQRLEYMGQVLEDALTLDHYRIQSFANLHLSVRPTGMQIHVKNCVGRTRVLDVQSTDTIASVKEKIEFHEGISPNHQRLIYSCTQLQDDKTLADYNIKKESTIFLLLRLRGGF